MSDINLEEIRRQDRTHVWHPMLQHRVLEKKDLLVVQESRGTEIVDAEGKRYLDAYAGIWNVNVGYGREEIVNAVNEQMKRLAFYPQTQVSLPAARLAAILSEILPGDLDHTFFCNSGSEANETAIKVARQYGRQKFPGENRYKIIARYQGYHGFTYGAMSATGQVKRREKFEPLVPGFVHVEPPLPGVDGLAVIEKAVEREGPETVVAVIAEPIIGGGGVLVPPDDYIPGLREICDKYGLLLILDEVITGFGRTGKLFASEHWGVVPDMMTMAKGISSGYLPLGACAVTQGVFEAFLGEPEEEREYSSISTYGGHPACCVAALANIEILLKERLWENAERVGCYLLEGLQSLASRFVGEVRGKGLMIAIELVGVDGRMLDAGRTSRVQARILEEGVIVGKMSHVMSGPESVLFLAPPLILSEQEADRIIGAIRLGLDSIQ
jgi:adenosylmethionine-8-amino-7-oxononanoate aminotransferase